MSVLGELFDFWWQVHEGGYEPGRRTDKNDGVAVPEDVIQATAGTFAPTRPYHFEDEHNGVFREFAALAQTPEAAAAFAGKYGFLRQPNSHFEPLTIWYQAIGVMKALVDALDCRQYDAVYDLLNNRSDIRPRISAAIRSIRAETERPIPFETNLKLTPDDLLSAMWLQLAYQSTRYFEFKQCDFCPNWFPVGPGTGVKPSKRFCSGRCRTAWRRQQLKET